MNKFRTLLILSGFLLCLLPAASGQLWLEVGVQGQGGASGFFNGNIQSDVSHNYSFGGTMSFGILAALNLGQYHGFNFELQRSKHSQNFSYGGTGTLQTHSLDWNNLDFSVLYRYYTNGGAYIELGPQFSKITNLEQVFESTLLKTEEEYEDNYLNGVFGIGGFIAGSSFMTLKLGLRASYSLTDLVSEAGQAANYPAFYTDYPTYKETHPFFFGLRLEMTFGVGGLAKSECGGRSFLFGTRYQ